MVETPAPISRTPVYTGMATASLVLGIVGIIFPFIGLILGILALIFGIVALRHKTTHHVPAIIGIITGGVAVVSTIALIGLLQLLAGGNFNSINPFGPNDRDKAVTELLNAEKDFKLGETAQIGTSDVLITKFERNYVPTAAELAERTTKSRPLEYPTDDKYASGNSLTEDEVEYVLIQGQAKANGRRNLGDGSVNFYKLNLNYVAPYTIDQKGVDPTDDPVTGPKDGYSSFTLLYRIRSNSSRLTLSYFYTFFKSVSPIVGTEGAPRASINYTITLN